MRLLSRLIVNLIDAINGNANLSLITTVDHAENAENAGLDLLPTRVVIFGNPNLGTVLMQEEQTAALDLPQKMLIYQNDIGLATIAYNSPTLFNERHTVNENDETLEIINTALNNLANSAGNIN